LEYSAIDGDVKGHIILDANASVKPTPKSSLPKDCKYGFEILTAGGNLELAVVDEVEQKNWIKAVQLCVQGDVISEAKIQRKIYDDHVRRKKERDERKEREAEEMMQKALLQKGKEKVLLKKASSIYDEVAHEPSRESLEAEALLMGGILEKKIMKHAEASGAGVLVDGKFYDGDTVTTMEVDTTAAHAEIMAMTAKIKDVQQQEIERKEELIKVQREMKEREQKINELRRKHQVKQNFRAAVRRAIMQHKFITEMHDNAAETRIGNNKFQKNITKEHHAKIQFEQGEKSEMAGSIQKMLAKKAIERQMQLKMMTPPPPAIIDSIAKACADDDELPAPPPRTKSVKFRQEAAPPPPTAPRPPPPRVDSEVASKLFNALPPEVQDDGERVDRIRMLLHGKSLGDDDDAPPPPPPPPAPP
jgi:hypothetical protein